MGCSDLQLQQVAAGHQRAAPPLSPPPPSPCRWAGVAAPRLALALPRAPLPLVAVEPTPSWPPWQLGPVRALARTGRPLRVEPAPQAPQQQGQQAVRHPQHTEAAAADPPRPDRERVGTHRPPPCKRDRWRRLLRAPVAHGPPPWTGPGARAHTQPGPACWPRPPHRPMQQRLHATLAPLAIAVLQPCLLRSARRHRSRPCRRVRRRRWRGLDRLRRCPFDLHVDRHQAR